MGALDFTFDDSGFRDGIGKFDTRAVKAADQGLTDIGTELLHLSQVEVPLGLSKAEGGHPEKGHPSVLQNSGETHREGDYVVVGYHTEYAAHLHEHPEYHFNHGRKGKYLEDPLKHNLAVFRTFMERRIKEAMGGI